MNAILCDEILWQAKAREAIPKTDSARPNAGHVIWKSDPRELRSNENCMDGHATLDFKAMPEHCRLGNRLL